MVTTPHLPDDAPLPPTCRGVLPLDVDLGSAGGHRVLLLSLECWDGWADLRFARVDLGDSHRLARRVPPKEQWRVRVDGHPVAVFDAVGRGDRLFSNGEVRLVPPPAPGAHLDVEVVLIPGQPPLRGAVDLPG